MVIKKSLLLGMLVCSLVSSSAQGFTVDGVVEVTDLGRQPTATPETVEVGDLNPSLKIAEQKAKLQEQMRELDEEIAQIDRIQEHRTRRIHPRAIILGSITGGVAYLHYGHNLSIKDIIKNGFLMVGCAYLGSILFMTPFAYSYCMTLIKANKLRAKMTRKQDKLQALEPAEDPDNAPCKELDGLEITRIEIDPSV